MGMLQEYKAFISKGNVVDMAVGVIIGGAFGKIVASFIGDVVMPPLGMAIGGVDFKELKHVLQEAVLDANGEIATAAVSINYGQFIQTVIEFLIIAWVIFLAVKGINNMKKKEEAAPAAPPAPTKEEILLAEIRDLLKK